MQSNDTVAEHIYSLLSHLPKSAIDSELEKHKKFTTYY